MQLLRLSMLAVVVALAACASQPPGRYAGESPLTRYAFEARFAWREGEQVHSGRLSWVHRPDADRVLLQDPFGGGFAELWRTPERTRLTLHDGRVVENSDAQALTREALGLALPLADLGVWLTGRAAQLAAAGGAIREADGLGRVVRFEREPWDVRFEYAEERPEALPSRVVARRADGAELRLAVERWEILE